MISLLHLEPLVSVVTVFRNRNDASKALPHVLELASAFLDSGSSKRWSIERACEEGFGLRLLKRLAAHETTQESTIDPFYRSCLSSKALVAAIRRSGDLEIVQWICCEYCPSVVPVKAMEVTAKHGRLQVLQWLFEKYRE